MASTTEWSGPLQITSDTTGGATDAAALLTLLGDLDVDELLIANKALLLRGFDLDPASVEPVIDRLLTDRLPYVHGNSPRSKVGQNLYTSTEYPPSQSISLHHELSYLPAWPSRLLFFGQIPAQTGGATPLADSAAWLAGLDPQVRAAFAGGLRYQQNLHGGVGLGKSWQDTFETDDRGKVEAHLAEIEATWSWQADGALRVSQVRPATRHHPVTGAEVWFNQADQWHVGGLGDETAAALSELLPEDELPSSVVFADGTPIPVPYIEHVREVGWSLARDVPWQAGDVLLIDNMLVGHGRRPFTGSRRVLVAMST